MDSCVYAFKLKFILKERMHRFTDVCRIRKHAVWMWYIIIVEIGIVRGMVFE